jgi:hypothetical protein
VFSNLHCCIFFFMLLLLFVFSLVISCRLWHHSCSLSLLCIASYPSHCIPTLVQLVALLVLFVSLCYCVSHCVLILIFLLKPSFFYALKYFSNILPLLLHSNSFHHHSYSCSLCKMLCSNI